MALTGSGGRQGAAHLVIQKGKGRGPTGSRGQSTRASKLQSPRKLLYPGTRVSGHQVHTLAVESDGAISENAVGGHLIITGKGGGEKRNNVHGTHMDGGK